MSNQETRFIRCLTSKPIVVLSHKVIIDTNVPGVDYSLDILYSESFEYKQPNDADMSVDLTVMDAPTVGKELNYILSIGGDSPGSEYIKVGELQYTLDASMARAKEMQLGDLYIFAKQVNVDSSHSSVQPQGKKEERKVQESKAKDLINKHLDDLIEQATLLKGELDPLERADAHARLHFSMSRLDRIESTQYRSRERPQRTRMVDDATERRNSQRPDGVYRESTDSFYTPSGEFIETREQRDKRLWGVNHRRGQFWERD